MTINGSYGSSVLSIQALVHACMKMNFPSSKTLLEVIFPAKGNVLEKCLCPPHVSSIDSIGSVYFQYFATAREVVALVFLLL